MGKGWLGAPLIKKHLRREKKKTLKRATRVLEPCGLGLGPGGPLKGPGGVQGGNPRKLLRFSTQNKHFSTQNYIHKIIKSKGTGMGCVEVTHLRLTNSRFCVLWARMNHFEAHLIVSSIKVESNDGHLKCFD